MKNRFFYRAARITLIYMIVAAVWIYLSDQLLAQFIHDTNLLANLSSLKGFGFVLVTGALLYFERSSAERSNQRVDAALRQAEHKYREIYENAPIGIFQVSPNGKYADANAVFAHMLGYDTPQQLITEFTDTPQGQPLHVLETLYKSSSGRLQYERQYQRRDGRTIDANLNIRLVGNAGDANVYLEGFVEDITARKAAEHQINQMADIVRSSQDAIYSIALNGTITSWNPAAGAIYGYKVEEILGQSALVLVRFDLPTDRARLRDIIYSGKSIRELEMTHLRKDQSQLTVSITASPIMDLSGQITGISVVARDITERNQITRRLEEQQHALREYAHRLIESQEDERKRLSRELHDDTLQDMVALAQRAELARTAMDRDPAVAARRLEDLQTLAREMIMKLRRISNDLRPLILEDLGIAAAVQFLCDELTRQLPVCTVNCNIRGQEQRLDPDVEITTFRIVQQALFNVRIHAPSATRVDVTLEFATEGIRATVQDNGPGFAVVDFEEMVRQGHLGLAGMQERANLLGGQVNVTSAPQIGTTITLALPYLPVPP